jgi:hypothetical protein
MNSRATWSRGGIYQVWETQIRNGSVHVLGNRGREREKKVYGPWLVKKDHGNCSRMSVFTFFGTKMSHMATLEHKGDERLQSLFWMCIGQAEHCSTMVAWENESRETSSLFQGKDCALNTVAATLKSQDSSHSTVRDTMTSWASSGLDKFLFNNNLLQLEMKLTLKK